MNWFLGDPEREATLLGAIGGRVGKVGREFQIAEFRITVIAEVVVLAAQIDRCSKAAGGICVTFIRLAFVDVIFLFGVIPFAFAFANNANVTLLDRLAEKIVGANLDLC